LTDTSERPLADRDILETVERSPGVLRKRQLAQKLGVADDGYRAFCRQLDSLEAAGLIASGKGNRYRLVGRNSVLGRLDVKAQGFGFVVPVRGDEDDVYVPNHVVADAMDGDLVLAEMSTERRRGRPRGPSASKLRVVERANDRIVGMFVAGDSGGGQLLPDNRGLKDVDIAAGETSDAETGEKVVARLTEFPRGSRSARAVVVRRLGEAGTLAAETEAVIEEFGLRDGFDEETTGAAQSAAGPDEKALLSRADYRDELTVTIDPADAADFDDAVSLVESDKTGWLVRVHIADVAAVVAEGSPVDIEARLRGTSVYLPGHVIPMLPERLTREVCCLREGEDSFAKTVTMKVAATGEVVKAEVERTVIRSNKRLSYNQVFAALEEGEREGIHGEILEMLAGLRKCAAALRRLRMERGSLDLDMPEARAVFEGEGDEKRIARIDIRSSNFAHQLIEDLMLAANRAVAEVLVSMELPGLFRTHDEPDKAAFDEFAAFVSRAGHKLRPPYDKARLQAALDHFRGHADEAAVNLAFLRSMKQARYSEIVRPHWALDFSRYCHFTSPIRRYPDLLVHRALDGAFQPGRNGLVKKKSDLPHSEEGREKRLRRLAHLAEICSSAERRAEKAERELAEFCQMLFLSGRTGAVAAGIIAGVEKYGIFVEIEGMRVQGLIHVSELPGEKFRYRRKDDSLTDRRTGHSFKFGQSVQVHIDSVDLVGRQIKLSLAE